MKKLLAIAAGLMLIGTTAFAQSFGAGYVNSIQKYNNKSTAANGFYAGFGYTAEILPGLSLNPGIYYEFITAPEQSIHFGKLASFSGKSTEHYVNVPLQLSYAIAFSPSFKLFLYGGPTANIGIASTTKVAGTILGYSDGEIINNYEDKDYSRFDIMLGGGIGAEIAEKVRITAGYDFGMLNRLKNTDDVMKRNRLTAGAAFIF
ncbi:MAG: PorT family protein [Bacteroidales bacterium]|nr:PorT family protein [Bacteroidales bacterium]